MNAGIIKPDPKYKPLQNQSLLDGMFQGPAPVAGQAGQGVGTQSKPIIPQVQTMSPALRSFQGQNLRKPLENPMGFKTDALGRVIDDKPAQRDPVTGADLSPAAVGFGFDASKLSGDPDLRARVIQEQAQKVAQAREAMSQETNEGALRRSLGIGLQDDLGKALIARSRSGDNQSQQALRMYGQEIDPRALGDEEFRQFQASDVFKQGRDQEELVPVYQDGKRFLVKRTSSSKTFDRLWDPNLGTYHVAPKQYAEVVQPERKKARGLFENFALYGGNILPAVGLGLATGGVGLLGGALAGLGGLQGAMAAGQGQTLRLTPLQMALGGIGGYANAASGAAAQGMAASEALGNAGRVKQSLDAFKKAQQLSSLSSKIRAGSSLGAQAISQLGLRL